MTDATATRTQQFIDALATLERDREVEPLAALFAPGSEIGNIVSLHEFTGPEGAREFWMAYRETFGEMRSAFQNVIEGDDRAALEWTTSGASAGGAPVTYAGVSIIEYADGQITRFHAYFDPSDLGRQMQPGATARG